MIFVTGMHRSGTSLVCQLMAKLDMPFGDLQGLADGDQWNEEGYFEQPEVIDLNSELITGFPRYRDRCRRALSQLVYIGCPPALLVKKRAAKRQGDLAALCSKHANDVVKDVRFCLTLSSWLTFAPRSKTVVCLRPPAESVASLRRRDRLPMRWGYRFWNYHVRELVTALEAMPTGSFHLIRVDRLRGEGMIEELESLLPFLRLDMSIGHLTDTFRSVYKSELQHCRAPQGVGEPDSTVQLWRRLLDSAS